MVNTNPNKIPDYLWERVYPDKKGYVTIIFNEKMGKQRRCRELNYKLKELFKG
jgi:hypothetical protein